MAKFFDRGEVKFQNGDKEGWMINRHVFVDGVVHIGKEIKNPDIDRLIPQDPTEVKDKKQQVKETLEITPEERRKMKWGRQKLSYRKKVAMKGKTVRAYHR